jgi:AcrR family transcriptional regulator
MHKGDDNTREKILLAALALFAEQGIGKTSVDEVAYRAGVTRVTVYRYFSDKKELTHRAFLRVEQIFQDALDEIGQEPELAGWERAMLGIGERLGSLPRADVFARAEELKRLYPDVYAGLQEVRTAILDAMFERFFAVAQRSDLLRPGLTRPIIQAVFWELTVNLFDNPRFRTFGLSDAELYHLITDILLHGVLKR